MKMNTIKLAALFALIAVGSGCSDPIVGEWKSSEKYCANKKRDSFSLDGDLIGEGEIVVGCFQETGNAAVCDGDFEAVETKDGHYDIEVDVGFCEAVGKNLGKFEAECELRKDDTELRCEVGSGEIDYERAD